MERVLEYSDDQKLQVILLKLWDIGKFLKYSKEIEENVPVQLRRSEKLMNKKKVNYLNKKHEHVENVPLRTLMFGECQNLLGKIALGIFIVIE